MFILLEKIKVIKPWEIYQNKVSTKILMHDKAQNQIRSSAVVKKSVGCLQCHFGAAMFTKIFFFFLETAPKYITVRQHNKIYCCQALEHFNTNNLIKVR